MDKSGIDAGLEFVLELRALKLFPKLKKIVFNVMMPNAEPPIHKLPPLQQSSI
jgi:hypothetical protein